MVEITSEEQNKVKRMKRTEGSLRDFWDCINRMLVHLILSQTPLKLSSVIFILFALFCSSGVISTVLSSSSLIRSSASDILLLIPSRVFLISVIVLFFSACLFFFVVFLIFILFFKYKFIYFNWRLITL